MVKQETATPAPAVKSQESANHPFHIIVAGGISLKDAEAIATQLKSTTVMKRPSNYLS